MMLYGDPPPGLDWRTSSHSIGNGQCAEVAATPGGLCWRKARVSFANSNCAEVASVPVIGTVLVRDSKRPHAGYLAFTRAEWSQFVAALKRLGR